MVTHTKQNKMSTNAIKVLILGPSMVRIQMSYFVKIIQFHSAEQKSGKTTLANFLSDAKDSIGTYRPTMGCRILEFQLEHDNNKGLGNREIQLWDCAGDPKCS